MSLRLTPLAGAWGRQRGGPGINARHLWMAPNARRPEAANHHRHARAVCRLAPSLPTAGATLHFLTPNPVKLLALLATVALLGLVAPAAQAQVNINININTAPSWGPALPTGAQYYYLPTVGGFYDVPARQYVVSRNGKWVRTATLVGYPVGTLQPVVVDYVGAQPWVRYETYRVKCGKGGHPNGVPPGQAKKLYRRGYEGYGYRHDDDHDDDHGGGNGRGHGKGKKDKGKGKN